MIYAYNIPSQLGSAYRWNAGPRFWVLGTPDTILPLSLSSKNRVRGGIKCAQGLSLKDGANVGTRWFGRLSSQNNNGCDLLVNAGGKELTRGRNHVLVSEETAKNCKVLWKGKIHHQGLFGGSSEVVLLKVKNPYLKVDLLFSRSKTSHERLVFVKGEAFPYSARRVAAEAEAKGAKPTFGVKNSGAGRICFTGNFHRVRWTPVWLRVMLWLLAASAILTLQLSQL